MKRVKLAEWPNGSEVRAGTRGVSISPRRLRKLAKAINEARALVKASKA